MEKVYVAENGIEVIAINEVQAAAFEKAGFKEVEHKKAKRQSE